METGSRGQTSVDFAIAMAVFLVALTTVVAFMPTMTQPFTGGQENPLVADRLAAQLVDGQLGDPSSPSHLDTTCTMFFFNESTSPSDPCQSFEPGDDLTRRLGVDENTFVNVTVRRDVSGGADPETVCAETKASNFYAPSGGCTNDPDDVRMAVGEEPPSAVGSVTLARRLATLNDTEVYVVVRVW